MEFATLLQDRTDQMLAALQQIEQLAERIEQMLPSSPVDHSLVSQRRSPIACQSLLLTRCQPLLSSLKASFDCDRVQPKLVDSHARQRNQVSALPTTSPSGLITRIIPGPKARAVNSNHLRYAIIILAYLSLPRTNEVERSSICCHVTHSNSGINYHQRINAKGIQDDVT